MPEVISESQALEVWFRETVAAPNEWRSRASTSAGLLSAAAAASVAVLLAASNGAALSTGQAVALVAAVILYGLGIICLLLASALPSPGMTDDHIEYRRALIFKRRVSRGKEDARQWLECYAHLEAAPLRMLTGIGAFLAAVALCTTIGAGVAISLARSSANDSTSQIIVMDEEWLESVSSICPTIQMPFEARLVRASEDAQVTTITIGGSACGGVGVTTTVASGAVIRIQSE